MISRHIFLAVFSLLVIASCADKSDSSQDDSAGQTDSPGMTIEQPSTTPAQNSAPAAGTAVSGSATFHYICPNNCEGSGGSTAGTCPVCGTAYVHNSAFHQQQSGSTPQQSIDLGNIQTQSNDQPNASGEWHYVCSANCGGGAGSAGNCPKCGAALTHNQAFHN